MRKLFFLFLLIPFSLAAKVYTPKDVPMVHLQNKTSYVCDPDNVLSPDSVAKMNAILYVLEQTTGIQTVVAVVGAIEPADCFDFAHELFTINGVGQKGKDNGLVVLLSTEERCIQFVTGYGLEGDLPDAICKRIQTNYMNEAFGKNDWDKGLTAGITALAGHLNGTMPINDEQSEDETEGWIVLGIMAISFMLFIAVIAIAAAYSSRCPKCKKFTLKRTETHLISKKNGVKTEEVVYTCTKCGNKVVRKEQSETGIGRGAAGGTIIGGGFGRGGRGGGGFGGGSFGGGFSGGGGAGSRF